jgi:ribosomal protein S18 acetylase RimI-like enzyme
MPKKAWKTATFMDPDKQSTNSFIPAREFSTTHHMKRCKFMANLQKCNPQYVALVDGVVVGWCEINRKERPVFRHCWVLGIGIMKNYRGQGIGKALLKISLAQARLINLRRIELIMLEGNKLAQSLYEKLGFRVEGVMVKAFSLDDRYEDLVCMALVWD